MKKYLVIILLFTSSMYCLCAWPFMGQQDAEAWDAIEKVIGSDWHHNLGADLDSLYEAKTNLNYAEHIKQIIDEAPNSDNTFNSLDTVLLDKVYKSLNSKKTKTHKQAIHTSCIYYLSCLFRYNSTVGRIKIASEYINNPDKYEHHEDHYPLFQKMNGEEDNVYSKIRKQNSNFAEVERLADELRGTLTDENYSYKQYLKRVEKK